MTKTRRAARTASGCSAYALARRAGSNVVHTGRVKASDIELAHEREASTVEASLCKPARDAGLCEKLICDLIRKVRSKWL